MSNKKVNPSCHGCAHEWIDLCDTYRVHMPSDSLFCRDCVRNPNPKKFPLTFRYITKEKFINEITKISMEMKY